MRSPDQHLSADEIELLGKAEGLSGELGDQLRPAREHAESCPACRRRLEVYSSSGAKLDKLRAPQRTQKGPDCPPIEVWLNLAGGLLTTAEQERYTAHAAQCNSCGPVLREVVEDFSEPMTEEEKAILTGLQVKSHRWQPAIANPDTPSDLDPESSRAPQPLIPQRRWFGFPRWQVSAVALIICAGVAFSLLKFDVFSNKDTVASVDQLLAKAYGEQRTIEMRISDAPYAAMGVTLGPEKSRFSQSPALLDAIAKLRRQVQQSPDDPAWLDAEGRADLLDGDFDGAVETLEHARRVAPESTSVLTDLATAYFERGTKNNISQDYGKAAELLGIVLQKSPNDPVALFNRALVNERQTLFPQAVADWNSYLRVDPNGDWSEEAKGHLKKLEQKILEQKNTASQPLAGPAEFVRLVKGRNSEVLDQIDQRIEDYQDHAIREWLPKLANNDYKGRSEAIAAMQDLADLLVERHSDPWFKDLLQQPISARFTSGLIHLGNALSASTHDDPAKALTEAEIGTADFVSALSETGKFRTELEEVHALRRAQEGDSCLEKANSLSEILRGHDYPWLSTQLNIDQGSCALMLGKFDLAETYVAHARRLASAHGYRDLELRSIGLEAGVRRDEGDLTAAWAEDQSGLWQYWANSFAPPIRAQFFYDDLSYLAESLGEWHSAVGFAQESARMLSLSGKVKEEALSRQHLAKIAVHEGNFSLAAEQLEKSSILLASPPSTENASSEMNADRLYSELALGEIEIEMGKLDDAQTRLSLIASDVQGIRSFTIPHQFYAVRGDLLRRQHRELEAEDALLRGTDISDLDSKEISRPSARYFWSQANSRLYRSLTYLELLRGDSDRAFSAWEWYKSGPLERSRGGPDSLRAFWRNDGLRDSLSSLVDQTVISYALFPQGLVIWVADDHGVEAHFTNLDTEQLKIWIAEFYTLCADKGSDITVIRNRGRRLFELLIAPVAHRLSGDRVVMIEPDEMMGDLPFQALVTPENHYFGEIYRIGFSEGLLYNEFLRPSLPILSSNHALIVGSTANVAGSDISLLPVDDVLDQVNEIAGQFTNPQKLKGTEATVDAMEALLERSDLLHFVGHAISSVNREGLLLFSTSAGTAPGATLWDSQRVNKRLFKRSRLVVLAACSTGRAYRGRIAKTGELLHSLLLSGVPHVIASRWDVDSRTTHSFMDAFYSALLSGKSVSMAVQFASNKVMTKSDKQRPFYWAAFAAFGRI
jgi:CHAT domain-containing protein/cytochrome c-type biogenesis protein CcmH/NrfG